MGGGAPSTTEGYHLAFGNIEEALLLTILGCKQRGLPSQKPLNHSTGYGFVAARKGHYSDGLAKGNQVIPLISETLGGINASALRLLTRLHAAASPENARDGTCYGTARCATTSFLGSGVHFVGSPGIFRPGIFRFSLVDFSEIS